MPVRPRSATAALLLLLVGGCRAPEPEVAVDDPGVDALYTDFLGGKFDGLGHPVGATVLEGQGCASETGFVLGTEVDAAGYWDPAGVLCQGETAQLGEGLHTVNVRAAATEACEDPSVDAGACAEAALEVEVLDAAGEVIASREVSGAELGEPRAYGNLGLDVRVREAGPVRVVVRWTGALDLRLEYVEVFRRDRQLVLEPASGLVSEDATFRIEIVDPPAEATLALRCGDADRTEVLDALIAEGEGAVEESEFRRIVTAPLAPLLEGCELPTRLVASLKGEWRTYATSEVFYLDEAPACPEDDGRPLVVLSGFLPFPAGSSNDNSSAEAVRRFDASAVDARVLPLILPVEFDVAAQQVNEAAARCDADVVVGFGQGRWQVDLETTAYNLKDTSDVAGGVPDNRGRVLDGVAIRQEGAPELPTRLPVDAIEARLADSGVDVSQSDDPGRYICNDVFYSIAHDAPAGATVGFVHLPIIRTVTEQDAAMLQTVVETVVTEALAAR